MKKVFALLTKADMALILFLILLTGLSYAWVGIIHKPGAYAIVSVGERQVGIYPLDKPQTIIKIKGILGEAELQIKDGAIRMQSAPCPQKICVKMGWIKNVGELIVCVPNQIVVRIEGASASEVYDGLSR